MENILRLLFLSVCFLTMIANASENHFDPPAQLTNYKYTFSRAEYFHVSFADYPKGQESSYELHFQEATWLPREIIPGRRGLLISGINHSDDLFMYAYKRLEGLKPNTPYHVTFSLEFASNAPSAESGTGGSPGSSVYVKIGVVAHEPERYLDENNYYRMNLDKGNQSTDGKDMIIIGTVGVDTHDAIYTLKTLPFQPTAEMQEKIEKYTFTTDENGKAWLVFGTDSGFESKSTFFYTNIVAIFHEINTN